MAKILKCAIVVVILALSLSSYARSEETSEAVKPQKAGRDLGMWWMRNPLMYDPMPEEFLHHIEIQYSYNQSQGNFTRDNHKVDAQVISRKGRFTNMLNYNFDKRHASRADDMPGVREDGSFYLDESNKELRNSVSHKLDNMLTAALTKTLFAAAGIEWTKDDYSEIENRFLYYGGLVYNAYQSPRGLFQVYGGYGYEKLEYTQDYYDKGWSAKAVGLIDYFDDGVITSDKYRLGETFRWAITPSLFFNESFDFIGNLKKKNDRSIFRWTLNVGFDYKIAEHVFLNAGYMESYDKAPDIGARKRDHSTNIGIKIVF
jgi:opacity protein-like surface antigen